MRIEEIIEIRRIIDTIESMIDDLEIEYFHILEKNINVEICNKQDKFDRMFSELTHRIYNLNYEKKINRYIISIDNYSRYNEIKSNLLKDKFENIKKDLKIKFETESDYCYLDEISNIKELVLLD